MRLDPAEIYFFEPDALQLDSAEILHAMQNAVRKNHVTVKEHTCVLGFDVDGQGRVRAVQTNHGEINCEWVVNAAGGWSAELFARMGLSIPVGLEPVYAANWLVSADDLPESLPIIADYVNRAYFRRWRGSVLHMHQPRDRQPAAIASIFGRSLMNPAGADVIFNASNDAVTHAQLGAYVDKVRDRFPQIGSPVYSGGYVSFFDITPDLKFILGPDPDVTNLVHCLGAGQALKYAPVFGEIIADFITLGQPSDPTLDLSEFAAARFRGKPLAHFWPRSSSAPDTL
jgi:glycine/D-amino acid oxidase-like deaminating enzyme